MTTATLTKSSVTAFINLINASSLGAVVGHLDAIFADLGAIKGDSITDPFDLNVKGAYGTYSAGLAVNKNVPEADSTQLKTLDVSWSKFQAIINENKVVPKGTYNMLGTIAGKFDVETGKGSLSYTGTGFSFDSGSTTKWSLMGSTKISVLFDQDLGTETPSFLDSYSSYSYTDSVGNFIQYTGNIKYDDSIDNNTGTVTGIKVVLDGITFSTSNLKVPIKDMGHVTDDMALEWILSGNDTLNTDGSVLLIQGFAGNDRITGSDLDDQLYGGNEWSSSNSGKDTIDGGIGNDDIYGGDGADTLSGGDGEDFIYGQKGNDKISGGEGNDWIYGDDASDVIDGGNGNDHIDGGSGKDTLTGGAGKDYFYFHMEDLVGRLADTLTKFDKGEDRIFIDDPDWNHVVMTANNFYAASGAKWAVKAEQKYIYDTTSGVLYFDADANGSGKGVAICTIGNKPYLSFSDFA